MSKFKYINKEAEDNKIVINASNGSRNIVLLEIVYQLKRIADKLVNK